MPDKFKNNDKGFKYSTAYREDNIIRPLCIVLSQMIEYIKCSDDGGKNMSFKIEDDDIFSKHNDFSYKIKMTLNVQFHSQPICDGKYIKTKVKALKM